MSHCSYSFGTYSIQEYLKEDGNDLMASISQTSNNLTTNLGLSGIYVSFLARPMVVITIFENSMSMFE